MTEKLFFLLLIVFLAAAVILYVNYSQESFSVSNFGKFADFTGLAKEKLGFLLKGKKEKDYFNFSLRQELLTLSEKHQALLQNRHELTIQRANAVKELLSLCDQGKNDAKQHIDVLHQEEKNVLKAKSRFEELGKDMLSAFSLPDIASREKSYEEFEVKLQGIFHEVIDNPKEGLIGFTDILKDLREMIIAGEKGKVDGCPDIKECLNEYLEEIYKGWKKVGLDSVFASKKDINNLLELLTQREYESRLMLNNAEATGKSVEDIELRLDGEFKKMVEGFAGVTEKDITDYLAFFKEMVKEETVMLANLELNNKRFLDVYMSSQKKMREAVNRLKLNSPGKFSAFSGSFEENSLKAKDSLKRFIEAQTQISSMITLGNKERQSLASKIAEKKGVDLDLLLEDTTLEQRMPQSPSEQSKRAWVDLKDKRESLLESTESAIENTPPSSDPNEQILQQNLKRVRDRREERLKQQTRQEDINNKMQREKDRVTDSGFYN
ncbi:MAG: hypothetical protein HQL27_01915 [Candidatus Omnitrophica bacterium]|nr:hypothetical protein [Candidatus Omnitrophota bacterium]